MGYLLLPLSQALCVTGGFCLGAGAYNHGLVCLGVAAVVTLIHIEWRHGKFMALLESADAAEEDRT